MIFYSNVHETELVSPSVAAASAAPTEYLTVTPLLVVVPPLSDDDPPEEDEPPDGEASHGGEGQAKQVSILTMLKNITSAINFFTTFLLL